MAESYGKKRGLWCHLLARLFSGGKAFPSKEQLLGTAPPHHISSFFQHLRFPHVPGAGTQPRYLRLPSPHPSPASAPGKESSQLERVCGATFSPGVEHPGTQHCRPAQTKGGPGSVLSAGKGPDPVTAACPQHGQEPGSVGALAPWTSPPHQAGRVGRDEASCKMFSRSCFAPSSWQ